MLWLLFGICCSEKIDCYVWSFNSVSNVDSTLFSPSSSIRSNTSGSECSCIVWKDNTLSTQMQEHFLHSTILCLLTYDRIFSLSLVSTLTTIAGVVLNAGCVDDATSLSKADAAEVGDFRLMCFGPLALKSSRIFATSGVAKMSSFVLCRNSLGYWALNATQHS